MRIEGATLPAHHGGVPYREAEKPADDGRKTELVYVPTDANAQRFPIGKLALAVPIVLVAGALGMPLVGGAGLASLLGWIAWGWARGRDGAVRLRIDDGALFVARGREEARRLTLREILSVSIDTEEVNAGYSRTGPDGVIRWERAATADVARIVIVLESGELRLSDAFARRGETLEWLRQIRLLLRGHGWVPDDERPAAGVDEDEPPPPPSSAI